MTVKTTSLAFLLLLCLPFSQASGTIVSYNLGNFVTGFGTNQLISGVNVNGSQHIASGTHPSGVTFTLSAVGSNSNMSGGAVNNQGAGAGVSGGQAGSGLDNNFNNSAVDPNFFETLAFSITNVSGGTVVFDGFRTAFGTENMNMEYMNVNGGAPQLADSNLFHPAAATSSLTVSATPFAVQPFDSRFVIAELQFDIVPNPIPEPSALALFSVGAFWLTRRRR